MASPSQDAYRAFPGSAAFSDFRLNRLASAIGAKKLQAIWVHYVASKQELSTEQVSVLDQLLEYGAYPDSSDELYSACVKAIKNGSGSNDPNTLALRRPETWYHLALELQGHQYRSSLWSG